MSTASDDPRIARGMKEQLDRRRRLIAAGAKPLGWKVGFGAPASMAKLAISGPLVGFMLDSNLLPSGTALPLAGWIKPLAEPEIAIEMGSDLPGGASAAAAAAAIGALGPAIELADATSPPEDVVQILAENIFHRHVILGPRARSRAGGAIDGLRGRIVRRGAAVAEVSDLESNTGKLVDIVRRVADLLASSGERLCAGDIIIAGSVIPPIMLAPDEDDDIEFVLEPIGAVRFRAQYGA
jgi:2-keto-4-pentenoate hydratase